MGSIFTDDLISIQLDMPLMRSHDLLAKSMQTVLHTTYGL
jgi:hypothetical protein